MIQINIRTRRAVLVLLAAILFLDAPLDAAQGKSGPAAPQAPRITAPAISAASPVTVAPQTLDLPQAIPTAGAAAAASGGSPDGSKTQDSAAGFSRIYDGGRGGSNGGGDGGSLEEELAAQNTAIKQWRQSKKRTMVVVQSMSLDADLLKHVKGIENYESRDMAMIMEAKDPNLRIIFVTSRPIPPYVIDHALEGHPAAATIRKNVTFLPLGGADSPSLSEPLSVKLNRPENRWILDKIKGLIRKFDRPAAFIPFITSPVEWELAMKLDTPLYGSHPALANDGKKSGSRKGYREEGLPLLPGFEDIRSLAELPEPIDTLWAANPGLKRVMIKVEDGVSGMGNMPLTIPNWSKYSKTRQKLIRKALMTKAEEKATAELLDQFNRKGGIVEEFLEEAKISPSPSAQLDILPEGPSLISTHEQRLAPDGTFLGANYPADPLYRALLEQTALKVGWNLWRKKHRGRASLDTIALRLGQGKYRIIPVETNIRRGGTTHIFNTAKYNMGAEIVDGLLALPDGSKADYNATDHAIHPGLAGIDPKDFLDFFSGRNILFHERGGSGVKFHLLDAIPTKANVGYVAMARSRSMANRIEARLKKLLAELERKFMRRK